MDNEIKDALNDLQDEITDTVDSELATIDADLESLRGETEDNAREIREIKNGMVDLYEFRDLKTLVKDLESRISELETKEG